MEKLDGLKWTVMVLHLLVSIITKAELLSATRLPTKPALWSKKDPTLTLTHVSTHTHTHTHLTWSDAFHIEHHKRTNYDRKWATGSTHFHLDLSHFCPLSLHFQLLVYQCHSAIFTGCFRHVRIKIIQSIHGRKMSSWCTNKTMMYKSVWQFVNE